MRKHKVQGSKGRTEITPEPGPIVNLTCTRRQFNMKGWRRRPLDVAVLPARQQTRLWRPSNGGITILPVRQLTEEAAATLKSK
ncbi:unnamed protein product [Colias eurytheme]|nr:unnamed protein product [Colias eurytheme]